MSHYSTLEDAAAYFGVVPQTIRNWGRAGKFKLYRLPGGRSLRVRIDEIEAALRVVPTVRRTA
jgi:excisionase family DNA binding protein